ncbi:MAG: hypothetical protein JSU00_18520 [Acidobacteria bacterium]|nr:hypothetical protein [Acidobacteriota bacterium]
MTFRVLLLSAALAVRLAAAVPTPREHLGFTPGDEHKLASYTELTTYFQKLAASSDRILLREFGKTTEGRPMYAAFISDPANLKRLDEYRDINRKLALGLATPEQAATLAAQGKAFVWIDSGLHATEVAPSQQAPDLAYKLITDESEESRRIRQNVILIQIPCINPDGLDMVVDWYRSNIGTKYELAPLPRLYQKFAGHDNNRDFFMLNLRETRNVTALLFQEWFPEIVYNQHQAPPFPSRIFIPPYGEPLNPNIPAPVMEGINLIGATMRERFAQHDQPGALSYWGFDAWWNGGLRSVPAFHNMHGILTETAGFMYGNSKEYSPADFPARFGNGMPTKEPGVFYEKPWMGGKWGVRQAIDYMLTADYAILDLASTRRAHFLHKSWEMAHANLQPHAKGPWAYVIPQDQWDTLSAKAMLWRLQYAGVQARRAAAPFDADGKTYRAGTVVLPAEQPFRGYLLDLMEPQRYPDMRSSPTGPQKRPYDVAGWTLPMQMGVQVVRLDKPAKVVLEDNPIDVSAAPSTNHRDNGFFLTMAARLAKGEKLGWSPQGALLDANSTDAAKPKWEFAAPPRVAIYEPWVTNSDAGWTDWLLTTFHVPHAMLHNEDIRKGSLRDRFDTIILASQSATSILRGIRDGERSQGRADSDEAAIVQRPEYVGGIELAGLVQLESFVSDGGTLIAFDAAAELPVQQFPLPVRLLIRPQAGGRDTEAPTGFYCPGSVVRITVDETNPIAFGMPPNAYAYVSGGQAFESTLLAEYNKGDREVRAIASYAASNLLASGWITGERTVAGKPALIEARHEKGKVLLFGFRPQHRGQTYGTFKLLLNAIYLASAKSL